MRGLLTLLLVASCLTAVGQSEYCLEGTVWDDELQGCVSVILNSADINNDGCVQLGDLLALLTAYGNCGDATSLCPNILNGDGGLDVEPSYFECTEYNGNWTFYPKTDGSWNDVTVDWGDGTSELFPVWDTFSPISHEYDDDHAWYTITFTQDVCEQTATLLKSVSVNPGIVVSANSPTGACAPATLTFLNASTSVTPDTEFEWTFDDGTVSGVLDASNAGALVDHSFSEFNGQCQREVTLQATNACRQAEFGMPASVTIDHINIWDKDNPIIGASSLELVWPENTVDLQNVSEKVCLNNGNTQQRLEKWTFSGPYGPEGLSVIDWRPWNDSNPITLNFPGPGEYEVSLAIQNFCGTEDTTIVIVVNDAVETVWQCGDPVSYQGYDYATVLIGEQCWFAENLRNENYRNGDAISAGLSSSDWLDTSSGAVAVYGEGTGCTHNSPDIDACDPAQSLNEYGRLYNWYAVDDTRGLCPGGWHVPTDGEWMTMTDHLGGLSVAGGQMKTDYGWGFVSNGTNSSGFSGLPGGAIDGSGQPYFAGEYGHWWSSSILFNPEMLFLKNEDVSAYRSSNFESSFGFSIRCIKNAE